MVPSTKTPSANRRTYPVGSGTQATKNSTSLNLCLSNVTCGGSVFGALLSVAARCLGPIGHSGFCGVFVPGFRRADWLPGT